jgi:hypothetical protein
LGTFLFVFWVGAKLVDRWTHRRFDRIIAARDAGRISQPGAVFRAGFVTLAMLVGLTIALLVAAEVGGRLL